MAKQSGHCSHCGDAATMTCLSCKNISYCTIQCRDADKRTHKLLCSSFVAFQDRPSAKMRRAILLPEYSQQPHFVWIPTIPGLGEDDVSSDDESTDSDNDSANEEDESEGDQLIDGSIIPEFGSNGEGGNFAEPDIYGFFGKGQHIRPEQIVLGSKGSGEHLDHGIDMWYKENFRMGDPYVNACLEHLTNGRSDEYWGGPILLVGMDKAAFTRGCRDLDTSDLTIAAEGIVDYVRQQNGGHIYGMHGMRSKSAKKVKGVLVHASTPHFEDVNVPLQHPIFTSGKTPQLCKHVGFPLRTYRTAMMLSKKSTLKKDEPGTPAAFLDVTLNAPTSAGDSIGTIPKTVKDNTHSVLVVLDTTSPPNAIIIEAACDAARTVMQQLNAAGASQKSKKQIVSKLTKEKFAADMKTNVGAILEEKNHKAMVAAVGDMKVGQKQSKKKAK